MKTGMMNAREIEKLVDLADAEQNGTPALRPSSKFKNNYSLRHTHRINGIGIEQIHHADSGKLSHAARKIASLFLH